MLVLTAVTAVQRFVTVWRQASAPRPVAGHRPGGGPGGRPARPSGSRCAASVASGASAAAAPDPAVASRALRAFQLGSTVVRALPRPGRRRRRPRWPAPPPSPVAGDRRAQVERNLRRVHGPGLRRVARCAGRSPPPSRATPATTSIRSACPARRPRRSKRASPSTAGTRSTPPSTTPRAPASSSPCPTSGAGSGPGSGSRPCRGRPITVVVEALEPPDLYDWFVDLREAFGMHVVPLGPGRGRGACSRRCAPATWSACCPTATSTAAASRSSSSASGPPCPAGPATLALRTGAPVFPSAVLLRGPPAPRRRRRRPRPHPHGAAARRRRPRHPGPRPRARGAHPPRPGAVAPPAAQLALGPAGARHLTCIRAPRRAGVPVQPDACPAACRCRSLGLARALRELGPRGAGAGAVRRPAARRRASPRSACRVPTAANGSVAPLAPDPSAQLRTIRALRDEGFDVVHLHEPLVPGSDPDRAAVPVGADDRARSTPPATRASYKYLRPAGALGGEPPRPPLRGVRRRRRPRPALPRRRVRAGVQRHRGRRRTPRPSRGRPRARRCSSSAATSPARASTSCSTAFATLPADVRLWVGRRRPRHRSAAGRVRRRRPHRVARSHRRRGEAPPHWPAPPCSARRPCGARASASCCSRAWRPARRWWRRDIDGYRNVGTDGVDARLVPPGDADALAAAIAGRARRTRRSAAELVAGGRRAGRDVLDATPGRAHTSSCTSTSRAPVSVRDGRSCEGCVRIGHCGSFAVGRSPSRREFAQRDRGREPIELLVPTIRATCGQCGDVELTTADVRVRVCIEDNQGSYLFRCPACRMAVVKPAEPRIVDLLVASGVELIDLDDAGGAARGAPGRAADLPRRPPRLPPHAGGAGRQLVRRARGRRSPAAAASTSERDRPGTYAGAP